MTPATRELTEHNRALAEQMYGAIARGDIEGFLSFISPNVVVEEPDFLDYGGTYDGIDGLKTLFAKFATRFDLSGLDFERIVVDGNYVCAICRAPVLGTNNSVVFIERVLIEADKVIGLRVYMYDLGGLLAVDRRRRSPGQRAHFRSCFHAHIDRCVSGVISAAIDVR